MVDNGPDRPVADVVAGCGIPATYLSSARNLGGAGGFALGMLHALALGADWVWCADDDGRPADTVLRTLLDSARKHGLAEVSPLVTDMADPDQLAFPLRRGSLASAAQRLRRAGPPAPVRVAVQRRTVQRRGARRDRGAGLPAVLPRRRDGDAPPVAACRAALRDLPPGGVPPPGGTTEFHPILGGRLSAQTLENEVKRFITGNRGYLMAQPGMRWLRPGDRPLRWFFLAHRRDPGGWREWLRLTRAGRRERFSRP